MSKRTRCLALVCLALATTGVLHAAEEPFCIITVTEGSSLQAAIDAAPSGAVICLEAGTWNENVIIRKSLTLRGAGVESTRLVAVDDASSVLDIRQDPLPTGPSSLEVRVTSLSVRGGMTGINIMGSVEVHLLDILVEDSLAFGVYASDGQVVIENSTVQNNACSGILVDSAQATISQCHVLSNAENGIYLLGHWASSTISLVGNTISANGYFGVSLGDNFIGRLTGQDNVIPDADQPNGNEIAAFPSDDLRFLTTATGGTLGDEQEAHQPPPPSAETIEIAYDDEISDRGRGWAVADYGNAVRFSPPAGRVVLVGARLFITGFSGGQAPIRIHVWDTVRAELIPPVEVTPTDSGWLEVDLSAFAIRIDGEDFYIGYTQTSADQNPWIGNNRAVPSDRSYNLPAWSSVLPLGTNIMIRAVVAEDTQVPGIEI